MKNTGLIGEKEKAFTKQCLEWALEFGADAARVSILCSEETTISSRDSVLDEINSKAETAIMFNVFVGGRYGSLNAHRMDDSVKTVLQKGIGRIRLLAPENERTLPPVEKKAKGFISGDELDINDPTFFSIGMEEKLEVIKKACAAKLPESDKWDIVSIENEYSDNILDVYTIDSEGFEGRNICTDFGFSSDVTICDREGNKYSDSDRNFAICFKELEYEGSVAKALDNAVAKLYPIALKSGRYDIVVDRLCGVKLLSGILNAMDAFYVQQNYSFLGDSLGKKVFPAQLNITDRQCDKHKRGCTPFDSETVAAKTLPMIENGVVKNFICDTYTSRKTGFPITVNSVVRPCIAPFICNSDEKEITLERILEYVGDGLYISDFNGGNSNPASGEFSFGIEGMFIEGGKITKSFKEALMTGQLTDLWKGIIAAGSDFKAGMSSEIPTLAFRNVNVNA